jgi:hypothetical protein
MANELFTIQTRKNSLYPPLGRGYEIVAAYVRDAVNQENWVLTVNKKTEEAFLCGSKYNYEPMEVIDGIPPIFLNNAVKTWLIGSWMGAPGLEPATISVSDDSKLRKRAMR